MSIRIQVQSILQTTAYRLSNLNAFPSTPPAVDQYKLRTQVISTRVFIVLFIASTIILTTYTSAVIVTKKIVVKKPTLERYSDLYSKFSSTLSCPCKNAAIEYQKFLHVDYTLHQVCLSSFVTDGWINYVKRSDKPTSINLNDFQTTATYVFRSLRTLCKQVNDTVRSGVFRFNSTTYVNLDLMPLSVLQSSFETILNQFQASLINEFLMLMNMIRKIIETNNLYSYKDTSARLYLWPEEKFFKRLPRTYNGCSCDITSSCVSSAGIYKENSMEILYIVPGLRIGCYIFEALLKSNFDCFYNQTCFDELRFHIGRNKSFNGTIMSRSIPSRFSTNTTVGELLEHLMIEKWNWTIEYENYFNECRPIECQYIDRARNDAIYIVTTVIGLLGGLITVLKLFVPPIVRLIRRKKIETNEQTGCTLHAVWFYVRIIRQRLENLNFFPSVPSTTDPYKLRTQIISTYIFIISVFLSLTALLVCILTTPVTKTIIIKQQTITTYSQLQTNTFAGLHCPCTNIAVQFKKILRINYTLHQVCSSSLVEDEWISYIAYHGRDANVNGLDFRKIGPFMFQALSSLCKQVNDSIGNSIYRFYTNHYINIDLMPYKIFEPQIKVLIKQFQQLIINEFNYASDNVRSVIHSNALLSAIQSNAVLYRLPQRQDITTGITTIGDCSCAINSECNAISRIYLNSSDVSFASFSGLSTACFAFEALLKSSFDCFYNQTCFDELRFHIGRNKSFNGTIMNRSIPSRFSTNTTVGELLEHLMIEKWNWTIEYENYFNECRPIECQYIDRARNDAIYIVTTVIGLLGGLITVLKLFVPPIVRLIRRKKIETNEQTVKTSNNQPTLMENLRGWQHLRRLNCFSSSSYPLDQYELRTQMISTYLFVILLILSVIVLLIGISTATVTQTIIVQKPSLIKYSELYLKFSSTLSCPCTKIAIEHGKFFDIKYTLHQICSADWFIENWLNYLAMHPYNLPLHKHDFRSHGMYTLRALKSICKRANHTIIESLSRFNDDQYVSVSLTPLTVFQSDTQSFFNRFQSSTIMEFQTSLRMISEMIHNNLLYSYLQTNVKLSIDSKNPFVVAGGLRYGNCTCDERSTCIASSNIFKILNESSAQILFIIPGIYLGCSIFEALLQSNLKCFYDLQCFEKLVSSIDILWPFTNTILNASAPSRFSIDITIGELLENMMIEKWNWSSSYVDYFNDCSPNECIYMDRVGYAVLYVVTATIAMIGGIITVLRLVIPRLVRLLRRLLNRRRTAPVIPGAVGEL